jgi:uncharacterized DUF497 family protein
MQVTYDPAKRAKTLQERGLDFEDAGHVLSSPAIRFEDTRADYGECRMICIGMLRDRMVAVGYVQRGPTCHVFSMRKCNAREIKRYAAALLQQAGQGPAGDH